MVSSIEIEFHYFRKPNFRMATEAESRDPSGIVSAGRVERYHLLAVSSEQGFRI